MRTASLSSARRALPSVALALGIIASVSACGGGETDASAGEKLVVGSDLTYPPYAHLDDDKKPAGFEVDITKALAKQAGMTATYKDTRFEQLIPSLASGQVEVVASALYITADRAKQVDYIPHFSTGSSLVSLADGTRYADAMSLCGKSVSGIKGGSDIAALKGEASDACVKAGKDPIEAREFDSNPSALQALRSGQVNSMITDAAAAAQVVDQTKGEVVLSSTDLLFPKAVGMAVKKGNTELKKVLEDALAAFKESGGYDALLKEYNLRPVDQKIVDKALAGS